MDISNVNNIVNSSSLKSELQKVEDDQFQRKLKSAMDSKDKEELKKVSQELESIFLNMMFGEMRNTVVKSDLVKDAPGHEIWQSMFDEKVAEESSKGKGAGLAEVIYKQISRNMENTYKIEEDEK